MTIFPASVVPLPCAHVGGAAPARRVLVVADMVHPYIYRSGFPKGLPAFDLVLSAGDVPGYLLEFLASSVTVPVVYVPGNHQDEYVREGGVRRLPRGVMNAEGRVLRVAGLTIAGWGGVPKYREGEHQYTSAQARWGLGKLAWQARSGVDIFLTHAPPLGPHAGSDYAHRGCSFISRFIQQRRPHLVVHGHIHEYEGKKLAYTDVASGARVVNAYGYQLLDIGPAEQVPLTLASD